MKILLAIVIGIFFLVASVVVYTYSTQLKVVPITAVIPLLGFLWLIVQYVIDWRKQPSVVFGNVGYKNLRYHAGNGKEDIRKGYFLTVNRKGNQRPEECAANLQIKGRNINNYTVWENRRKYSPVGIGTLLKLFEISADLIVFDIFPPHDEEHFFSQNEKLQDFLESKPIVMVSPKNASVSKNYSRCIADIIKRGNENAL
jgi:hypothetical protein